MKKYYPHVISTLALFAAMGGGAYAATVVSRAKVADNALRLGGVLAHRYHQDQVGGMNPHAIKLESANPTPLIGATLFNSGSRNAGFMSLNSTTVENPGDSPVNLILSLSVNGKQEPGSFSSTVNPGQSLTVPAIFAFEGKCKKCGLLNLGNNEVQLLGQVSNKGELIVENTSADDLRPIVIPPSGSSCCNTGAAARVRDGRNA